MGKIWGMKGSGLYGSHMIWWVCELFYFCVCTYICHCCRIIAFTSVRAVGKVILVTMMEFCMTPQWLVQTEKKLHSITPHSNFRLIFTIEINPNVIPPDSIGSIRSAK